MDFDKFLVEMQELITASQQGSLFGSENTHATTCRKACVEYLKGQGYSVRPPMGHSVKIVKLDELLSVFYGFLGDIYDSHLLPPSNKKKDRAVAKAFVEGRMETDNISRGEALQQCGLIIKTIFKYLDVFKFENPPTFGIFGQAKMGWITERAVQLINKEITKEKELSLEKAVNKMTKNIERDCQMGFSLDELTAIQKRLEDRNGKKEN